MFGRKHPVGSCRGCRRRQPLKKEYCRSCWCQARADGRATGRTGGPATAVHHLDQVGYCHQLFFADLFSHRGAATTPLAKGHSRGRPCKPPPPAAGRPTTPWVQRPLFTGVHRDFTRFDDHHADSANPWLSWANHVAHRFGEARGWTRNVRAPVSRGLVIVLSGHVDGDVIRYSELISGLKPRDVPVERVAEILTEMGVFLDDRRRPFDDWLDRKLHNLAEGIAHPAEVWMRTLHDGGPRSKARHPDTAVAHMNNVRPMLLEWSARYDHLREVTRDDVLAILEHLHGARRSNALVSLRSLFAFCKKEGTIFRNPTRGLKVGQHAYRVVQPLDQDHVDQAIDIAKTPSDRLVLVLAAVHAARPKAIRELLLDDVDLGNRRLVIAGRVRPVDNFTLRVLLEWLDYRRTRWPNTANPHLIINQKSAMKTGPVSRFFFAQQGLRGHAATLDRLRADRQLEEALTHGPDPLHLASVFGLDPKTAIRYAENARQHLETAAEQHAPGSSPRTQR